MITTSKPLPFVDENTPYKEALYTPPKPMYWIKDRLPDHHNHVLVYIRDKCMMDNCTGGLGQRFAISWLVDHQNWHNIDNFSMVTHWAELFKP